MANLIETAKWESGIYQLEEDDEVLGGVDGVDNRQGKQLANRTAWLKQEVEKRAPLASPALTGTPTAPTPAQTVNNTQIATTAYVKTAIAALVGSAPETLDTLTEIANALGGDSNLKATLLTEIAKKADKSITNLKTDNYVNVALHTNGYGGLSINGQSDYLRFERSGSKLIAYLRDTNLNQNNYLIEFPERSGVVPLAEDVNLKADNYVNVTQHTKGYGGLSINGQSDYLRFERSGSKLIAYLRDKQSSQNRYLIEFPERSGIVPLAADVNLKADNYVTTTAHADGYGGLTINSATGDDAIRFERSNGRAVVLNRNLRTLTNNYEITFPQRSGEVALAGDVVAKSAFTQSFATNGWSKLPNGLIVQWGRGYANKVDGDLDITLPIAFPTAALSVSAMHSGLVTDGTKTNVVVTSLTTSKVKFKCGNASDIAIYYFAIGY